MEISRTIPRPSSPEGNMNTNYEQMTKQTSRQAGLRLLLTGVAVLAAGVVITGISYSLAADGGTYIWSPGLLIGGAITMLRGLYRVVVA